MVSQASGQTIEPDLMLLHRFIDTGDAGAFAEIVKRYARVVYSSSVRILGDEARAQDVSQETFFRLMQRPKLVTHSLAGWLHRTATHLALDVRRSEKSRRQREQTYGLEQQENRSLRADWSDVSPVVDQALNEIKEPMRGLLIRHFLQGVQQADLAVEMNVSPATLSRRIKSGLEELQIQLRKKGVYVGIGALGLYCTANVHAAVPVAMVTEMGKMNLVAAVRHLPGGPPMTSSMTSPTTPPPPSFPVKPPGAEFVPAKFAWSAIAMTVLIALYAYATAGTWTQTRPFVSTPVMHHEAEPSHPAFPRINP